MNSKQRRKQRRKLIPLDRIVDVDPTVSPGTLERLQSFGRIPMAETSTSVDEILQTRPLADGDIKIWKDEITEYIDWNAIKQALEKNDTDGIINTGAVASNARPDSSRWSNLTAEQVHRNRV